MSQIKKLEAELAEARAQIEITIAMINKQEKLIAAKDAALERIANATGTYVSIAVFAVNEARVALGALTPRK